MYGLYTIMLGIANGYLNWYNAHHDPNYWAVPAPPDGSLPY